MLWQWGKKEHRLWKMAWVVFGRNEVDYLKDNNLKQLQDGELGPWNNISSPPRGLKGLLSVPQTCTGILWWCRKEGIWQTVLLAGWLPEHRVCCSGPWELVGSAVWMGGGSQLHCRAEELPWPCCRCSESCICCQLHCCLTRQLPWPYSCCLK